MSLSPMLKETSTIYASAEDVIVAIFNFTYSGCYLLPVKDKWKRILGEKCWVYDSQNSPPKQDTEYLKFTTQEFISVVIAAMENDRSGFNTLITAKKKFGGEIFKK